MSITLDSIDKSYISDTIEPVHQKRKSIFSQKDQIINEKILVDLIERELHAYKKYLLMIFLVI